VCRNKLRWNKIKKEKRNEGLNENTVHESVEIRFSESALDVSQLKDYSLPGAPRPAPQSAVVITLKYVVNLKVDVIAGVLGMTVDGVDKLLLRARQKIRDEKILLEDRHPPLWRPRLPTVHKIIYLILMKDTNRSAARKSYARTMREALLLNKASWTPTWQQRHRGTPRLMFLTAPASNPVFGLQRVAEP